MTTYQYTNAPNHYVNINGQQIAWRAIGNGRPLVLCQRFRGTMDSWDPAFIDALALHGFQVFTYDYAGLGLSQGEATYSPMALASQTYDFISALGLTDVVLGGWSLGGLVVQICIAKYSEIISHAVLIGTVPPGPNVKSAEQLFNDTARKDSNDLEDEIILFFEPLSKVSRTAAKYSHERIAQRQDGRCPEVPAEFARSVLGESPRSPLFPADALLPVIQQTQIPILHLGADHDIAFPIENWYAHNGKMQSLQLVTFPQCGHAPHHQYPRAAAAHISAFVFETAILA